MPKQKQMKEEEFSDGVTQLRCFFRRDLHWREGRLKGQKKPLALLNDMDGEMIPPEACDEVEAILFSKFGLELVKAAREKGYCVRERRSHVGGVMARPKCVLTEIPADPLPNCFSQQAIPSTLMVPME
jgi:hypothetical protein